MDPFGTFVQIAVETWFKGPNPFLFVRSDYDVSFSGNFEVEKSIFSKYLLFFVSKSLFSNFDSLNWLLLGLEIVIMNA